MKNTLKLSAIALALLGTSAAYAADHTIIESHQHGDGHKHTHGAEVKAEAKVAAKTDLADGEIRKINKNTGKITVKHGEIKSVEMPPMTMVFGVADKAMLEGLSEGDKVKFNVKQEGSSYTVTEIKKAQ